MADQDYVATLAGQLCTRRADALDIAEAELGRLRTSMQTVTRFLHNETVAYDIRVALARDLRLPEPSR